MKCEWFENDSYAGWLFEDGSFVIEAEYGLTDADTDKYAVEVQNGDGYYASDGHFVRFRCDD